MVLKIGFVFLGPYSFSIGDTSKYEQFRDGGIATEVKKEKMINFVSYNRNKNCQIF
jgi:ubiquitin-activating enzyme E1